MYRLQASTATSCDQRSSSMADGGAAPAIGIYWLATAPGRILFLPPWTVRHQPEGDSIEWLPAAQMRGTAAPATPNASAITTKE